MELSHRHSNIVPHSTVHISYFPSILLLVEAAAGLPTPPKFQAQVLSKVDVLLNAEPVPWHTGPIVNEAVGKGFTATLLVAVTVQPFVDVTVNVTANVLAVP